MTFEPLDLDDSYEDYMRRVAADVPHTSTQYKECRRVWVAAMRRIFVHITESVATLSEEDGVLELDRLREEMLAF